MQNKQANQTQKGREQQRGSKHDEWTSRTSGAMDGWLDGWLDDDDDDGCRLKKPHSGDGWLGGGETAPHSGNQTVPHLLSHRTHYITTVYRTTYAQCRAKCAWRETLRCPLSLALTTTTLFPGLIPYKMDITTATVSTLTPCASCTHPLLGFLPVLLLEGEGELPSPTHRYGITRITTGGEGVGAKGDLST